MNHFSLHVNSRNGILFIVLILLFAVTAIADLSIGTLGFSLKESLNFIFRKTTNPDNLMIFKEFRLPRVVTAIIAGAALSVSGLNMQTIFRNPLAGPYILGISAGAAFGVAVVMLAGFSPASAISSMMLTHWVIVLSSWLGAFIVLIIILFASLRLKNIMTILIIGILTGSALSAVVNILQYFSDKSELKTFFLWSMGSLNGVTSDQLLIFIPVIMLTLIINLLMSKNLNLMLLGEEQAKMLGLNITTTRIIIFLLTSMLAGTVTAFCGPIGFIGIVVPHISRYIFRSSNHFILIPATMLNGAMILLLADIFSNSPLSDQILPVNSITALLGIPIIIVVLIRNYTYA